MAASFSRGESRRFAIYPGSETSVERGSIDDVILRDALRPAEGAGDFHVVVERPDEIQCWSPLRVAVLVCVREDIAEVAARIVRGSYSTLEGVEIDMWDVFDAALREVSA
jgi:hypothetical protein